jgi:hypothetical protein
MKFQAVCSHKITSDMTSHGRVLRGEGNLHDGAARSVASSCVLGSRQLCLARTEEQRHAALRHVGEPMFVKHPNIQFTMLQITYLVKDSSTII